MKNKQHIIVFCFYVSASRRDASLGRIYDIQPQILHPVRDASLRDANIGYRQHILPREASLTGCRYISQTVIDYLFFIPKSIPSPFFPFPLSPIPSYTKRRHGAANLIEFQNTGMKTVEQSVELLIQSDGQSVELPIQSDGQALNCLQKLTEGIDNLLKKRARPVKPYRREKIINNK